MVCSCLWITFLTANWHRRIHYKQCHPYAGGPGQHKIGFWATQGKWSRKHHSSMELFQFLLPDSCLESLFCLPSVTDSTYKSNKSFPPQVAFGHCFITATEKQTEQHLQICVYLVYTGQKAVPRPTEHHRLKNLRLQTDPAQRSSHVHPFCSTVDWMRKMWSRYTVGFVQP